MFDPATGQRLGDTSGQIFSFTLRPCHIAFYIGSQSNIADFLRVSTVKNWPALPSASSRLLASLTCQCCPFSPTWVIGDARRCPKAVRQAAIFYVSVFDYMIFDDPIYSQNENCNIYLEEFTLFTHDVQIQNR